MRALLLLAACFSLWWAPASAAGGTLAVRCGRLIDGFSDAPLENATVLIRDGRVEKVGRGLDIPKGMAVLDLSSYTVLPGLIDMHTHLTDNPDFTADPANILKVGLDETLKRARRNAEATLRAGFTSVRDVGTYIAWADRDLRDEIEAGKTPGPRMQIAGFFLTIPGGGGDVVVPGVKPEAMPAYLRMGVARTPDGFRKKAELAVAGGADTVKVIASGAVLTLGSEPGAPEMTLEEIRAAADAAHQAGRRLAAHAHGTRSIRDAILAGADTVEHDSYLDDEGILMAKRRGVTLVMDVYDGDYIDTEGRRNGAPAEYLRKNLETMHRQRESFARALKAGVKLGFGTDAAVYPHGDNAKQFRVMAALGMTPMEAIRAATSVAARAMGWQDQVGSVAPGRFGDLIAVRGDPLLDVTALEDARIVVKGGAVVKSDANP